MNGIGESGDRDDTATADRTGGMGALHPSDVRLGQTGGADAERLFAGSGEMRARCRRFDWSATPLGPVEGWSTSLRTVAALVLASRHPMFLWWGPHLVQLYNDAYRPSLGSDGRHPRALGASGAGFWTDIWEAIGPQIAQVMAGGEATWHEDQHLPILRNGRMEDVWWTYSYSPVMDDDGRVGGTLVVCQETTGRVLADRQLEESAAMLARQASQLAERTDAAERANRSKSEFLAVMSHELRTPLNAISGYAELMELGIHGPLTPDQRRDLERIKRSQRHLLGLINRILDFAKLDAGAVTYELAEVSVGEMLAACESLTAPQARAKGLTLRLADAAADVVVLADREKVQQILLNLISNAIKFTESGGEIVLGYETREAEGIVRIGVRDSGRGIAADQLDRIFQPFVQVDARLTRTQEGTGLGLAISRELARGLGGDLLVESAPAAGSTFTLVLRLPAAAGRPA